MSPIISSLLLSYLGIAVTMALLWAWQLRSGRGSVVDIFWTAGVAVLSCIQLLLVCETPDSRQWLAAALITGWAVKLNAILIVRIQQLPEDGRYEALKESWKSRASQRMFYFFQLQAIACMLFALPFCLIAQAMGPLNSLDLVGVAIWTLGVAGGLIADIQLTSFRLNPKNRGEVCDRGLWRYSRHPNYFFEWVHWCSYVFLAWTAPLGWLILLAPLSMLYLLLFKTGVPPAEQQALASRGEAYRRYQSVTSIFFPWPPKAAKSEELHT